MGGEQVRWQKQASDSVRGHWTHTATCITSCTCWHKMKENILRLNLKLEQSETINETRCHTDCKELWCLHLNFKLWHLPTLLSYKECVHGFSIRLKSCPYHSFQTTSLLHLPQILSTQTDKTNLSTSLDNLNSFLNCQLSIMAHFLLQISNWLDWSLSTLYQSTTWIVI